MTAADLVAWFAERQHSHAHNEPQLMAVLHELAQVVARQQTVIDVLTSEVMGVRLPQHPPADVALLERRWMTAVEERDAAVGQLAAVTAQRDRLAAEQAETKAGIEALTDNLKSAVGLAVKGEPFTTWAAMLTAIDKLADDNDRLRRQISDREDDPELTSHLSDTCSASCRFCLQAEAAKEAP